MNRLIPSTLAALFLFTAFICVPRATAQGSVLSGRHVTVSGEGIVRIEPDQATIRFGVVTIDLDPEQARADNADVSAATLNAIRALDVEERKIQVNVLRIQPYSEYDPDLRRNVDKGFQAVREMTVVLDDLDVLPTLVAEIVGEGANRINGISYGLQDDSGPESEALTMAVTDAREKARLMAEALGARLGVVLQINEQGVVRPQPVMMEFERALAMKDESAPNPDAYASGEITVSAQVTVSFGLLPGGQN